jgi:cytochrome P450
LSYWSLTPILAILAVNTSPEIWGADAAEFNPDRFAALGDEKKLAEISGVWGHLLTFLGGPRNCLGYRFSLIEMKVILFVLLRSFKFEELPSKPKIEKKSS